MNTNAEARIWCSENYDFESEEFYIYNARKLILEPWRMSLKHAAVTTLLAIGASALGWISNGLVWICAMQIGYLFYGLFTYTHNDMGAGGTAYLCCLIYFVNRISEAPPFFRGLFYIAGIALLAASVLPEIAYRRNLGSYAKSAHGQWAGDEEEFEAWKAKYYRSEYNGYTQSADDTGYYDASGDSGYGGSSDGGSSSGGAQASANPHAEQARELFADFGTTYAELKKTYRKLAMKYHPDHGGDDAVFAAIVAEYEYLKATKFPGLK